MKRISISNLPASLNLTHLFVWGLLLDRFNAPAWLWGAVGLLAVAILAAGVYNLSKAEPIDIVAKVESLEKWQTGGFNRR